MGFAALYPSYGGVARDDSYVAFFLRMAQQARRPNQKVPLERTQRWRCFQPVIMLRIRFSFCSTHIKSTPSTCTTTSTMTASET